MVDTGSASCYGRLMALSITVSLLIVFGWGLVMYGYHGLVNGVKTASTLVPYFGGSVLLVVGMTILLASTVF